MKKLFLSIIVCMITAIVGAKKDNEKTVFINHRMYDNSDCGCTEHSAAL